MGALAIPRKDLKSLWPKLPDGFNSWRSLVLAAVLSDGFRNEVLADGAVLEALTSKPSADADTLTDAGLFEPLLLWAERYALYANGNCAPWRKDAHALVQQTVVLRCPRVQRSARVLSSNYWLTAH